MPDSVTEARADLLGLYELILAAGGAERAGGYLGRIQQRCLSLGEFPLSGRARPDVGPGIRSLGFERRVLLAYRVSDERVLILRILYAGREF